MKLKTLKLAHAIRVGHEVPAESFFSIEKGFDMELMPGGQIIKIVTQSRKCETFTTIYNVLNFDRVAEQQAEPAKKVAREAAVN